MAATAPIVLGRPRDCHWCRAAAEFIAKYRRDGRTYIEHPACAECRPPLTEAWSQRPGDVEFSFTPILHAAGLPARKAS